MLSAIVAMDENRVIGNNNKIPWHLKKDLAHFKELTNGHKIIMGRKTLDSIGRLLPNRDHIVLTRDKNYVCPYGKVNLVYSLNEISPYVTSPEEVFIIGGAEIYTALLPYCKKIYSTKIHHEFEGNVYFPYINLDVYKLINSYSDSENGINFDYNLYEFI